MAACEVFADDDVEAEYGVCYEGRKMARDGTSCHLYIRISFRRQIYTVSGTFPKKCLILQLTCKDGSSL